LAALVESAARRPALDPRPFDDIAKRVEAIRAAVERQSARPDAAMLVAALRTLDEKLDRASASGAQSAAATIALQGMVARLESALRRLSGQVEAALGQRGAVDVKPIEDLARRIDAMRKAVESNGALAPQVSRLESALNDIRAKLDRPPQAPQIDAVDAALRNL